MGRHQRGINAPVWQPVDCDVQATAAAADRGMQRERELQRLQQLDVEWSLARGARALVRVMTRQSAKFRQMPQELARNLALNHA